MRHWPNRRHFLQQITALGALTSVAPTLAGALPQESSRKNKTGAGFTFLFQGDSITDGNRTRDNDWNHVMGHGYAFIIASKLWYEFPAKQFHFFNRGVSGDKITGFYGRPVRKALPRFVAANQTTIA